VRFLAVLIITIAMAMPAHAGLNPASPGLPNAKYPDGTIVPNNQFSAMCVDCHSRNPIPDSGSHFVTVSPVASGTQKTRTGGGWGLPMINSQKGPRMDGSFLRINRWFPDQYPGGYSKYGESANRRSYTYGPDGNATGLVDNVVANYATREIICESCHNLRYNVPGGNNLLAKANPWTVGAMSTGRPPTICVGCHGYMYAEHPENAAVGAGHSTKYFFSYNLNEITGRPRGNNQIHFIGGQPMAQNHHVTEGDSATRALAAAGLLNRDVLSIAIELIGVPYPMRPLSQMPAKPDTQYYDFKRPSVLGCEGCHTSGHGGNIYMGTSILRDTSVLMDGYMLLDPDGATCRFGECGKQWMGFNDVLFCMDCHQLKQ
jgi:hypothetical protein